MHSPDSLRENIAERAEECCGCLRLRGLRKKPVSQGTREHVDDLRPQFAVLAPLSQDGEEVGTGTGVVGDQHGRLNPARHGGGHGGGASSCGVHAAIVIVRSLTRPESPALLTSFVARLCRATANAVAHHFHVTTEGENYRQLPGGLSDERQLTRRKGSRSRA